MYIQEQGGTPLQHYLNLSELTLDTKFTVLTLQSLIYFQWTIINE